MNKEFPKEIPSKIERNSMKNWKMFKILAEPFNPVICYLITPFPFYITFRAFKRKYQAKLR